MQLKINGQTVETSESRSLLEIVRDFGATAPFALAVNGQFVPKSQHESWVLSDQDSIEILSPVQGG
ncbi:ThiS protein [Catenovulum agarivorans DS-2]|uniref:ThiS protein n=1 Tax=Catenovulum agarivorans DS-2 TaxID=1328313 RepID=W7Q5X9_9ALTE|nr:sulfur carrier protein ThiS [Catenovulum agarivorans]EWH08169.1 ThiS protein [Catenovulum agarivorans DS-2]